MIREITVTAQKKSIPAGLKVILGQYTVLTGENNVGKTNFVEVVNDKTVVEFKDDSNNIIDPEIIYIEADNIVPSNNECKASAGSASLIDRLSRLFSNLSIEFKLEDEDEKTNEIYNLITKTNENLIKFSGKDIHKVKPILNTGTLDSKLIIQAMISKILAEENGTDRELKVLGQGTQRIIVASILKAYHDILLERGITVDKPTLLIFEEPEIYLHPRLKRTLNSTLEEVAALDNHQVLITTHDPYFAFKGVDGIGKSIISFVKEGDITRLAAPQIIEGIEDELLYIYLFSKMRELGISTNIDVPGSNGRPYKKSDNSHLSCSQLENIRHQIHHSGDNPNTFGLAESGETIPEGMNFYTQDDLSVGIKIMSGLIAAH